MYISPAVGLQGNIVSGDSQKLQTQVSSASNAGVPEKFAILKTVPHRFYPLLGASNRAADALRTTTGLSDGVLILIWPHGIGVSSSRLSSNDIRNIEAHAQPICAGLGYSQCAITAGLEAESLAKSRDDANNRKAALFWLGVLIVIGGVVAFFVWRARRNRVPPPAHLEEMRRAAQATLAIADTALADSENSMPDLTEELAALYDRAERLFELARVQTAESTTEAGLREANQNGAEAALLAARVLRSKALDRSESGANGAVSDRCLYCARDDRPPYSERVIDDSRGNQMLAQVCSHCLELLQQGRTPDVETVVHDGLRLPWWAEPGNAYFEAYEGSSWQYWLPLLVGMDAGTWFAKMRSEAGAPPTQQT